MKSPSLLRHPAQRSGNKADLVFSDFPVSRVPFKVFASKSECLCTFRHPTDHVVRYPLEALISRNRPIFRFAIGVLIVNVLPILGLWMLYRSDAIVPNGDITARALASAAVSSMAVFAIPRFLHAFLATPPWHRLSYEDAE